MKLLTCDDEELPRSWAPLIRKIVRFYLILSIPISTVFVCSPGTRFAVAQALARGGAAVMPVTRVFCGDQFTRDGGVWGWRIAANPFGTLNLAEGQTTSWQLLEQIRKALEYRPRTIYAMAGRFDVEAPGYNEDQTIEHLKQALELANDDGAHLVFTLAPYGTSPQRNEQLASLNARIEKELTNATILNLNNTIAPQGTIQNRYTADGVHLNDEAYTAWANLVKATMAGGDTFKPTDGSGTAAPRRPVRRR